MNPEAFQRDKYPDWQASDSKAKSGESILRAEFLSLPGLEPILKTMALLSGDSDG